MTDEMGFSDVTGDAEALRDVLDDLERRSRSFGSALTGALASATRGGKGLEDVLRSAGLRLTEIALSAGLKPLEGLLGSALSGLTGSLGGTTAFADGGVPGRVTPFAAGGVVSTPTYFPMGGEMGLMGEAGSEAILPLKRGADGALGVAASGAAAPMNVVFNVTASDAQSFRKSEGQIAAMLTRTVGRGRRGV
ncbi:phage tail tape measure protein [Rhizobium giardinii]|uniref:Phage-related minor tail protein n=1 Tax=Rhizobium giardinii TaxID=56731 RepID=A0A7W8X9N7_9HYPH|nr:phage tail tape measure protein [Rhizobium giardinii]MBB5537394.1 phage-related minor tail protein [Rhizobium giardinii]